MGQKVHPYGFRVGITKPWRSRWFAKQGYAKLLQEDLELKEGLRSRLKSAGVSSIEVDRPGNKLRVTIRTSRPGIIIGRKGAEIEKLKLRSGEEDQARSIHRHSGSAQARARRAAGDANRSRLQLEKRVAFRRAMRKAVDSALRFGCKGIKVRVSGRLNGAEIARSEWYLQGQLPLHTLRADIDYGFTEAHTTYGVIGIKAGFTRVKSSRASAARLNADPEPRRERSDRDRGGDRDRRGPRRDDRGGDRGADRGSDGRPPREPQPGSGRRAGAPGIRRSRFAGSTWRYAASARRVRCVPPLMSPAQPILETESRNRPQAPRPRTRPATAGRNNVLC